jgi:hypothetical protein
MIGAVVGTIAIVALTIAIGRKLDRKVGILPRTGARVDAERPRAPVHGAGEAAATAIRAGTAQVVRLRASQRCTACRTPLAADADDQVRYAGRELLVLHFHCPACGAKRSLYVAPAA